MTGAMTMGLLSSSDKTAAARDVAALISSSGTQGSLFRPVAGENFYGNDCAALEPVGVSFPIEFVATPPEDLSQHIDATACVLPELDVRAEDRLRMANGEYRVQTVQEERLFGALTHKVLKLVKHHAS